MTIDKSKYSSFYSDPISAYNQYIAALTSGQMSQTQFNQAMQPYLQSWPGFSTIMAQQAGGSPTSPTPATGADRSTLQRVFYIGPNGAVDTGLVDGSDPRHFNSLDEFNNYIRSSGETESIKVDTPDQALNIVRQFTGNPNYQGYTGPEYQPPAPAAGSPAARGVAFSEWYTGNPSSPAKPVAGEPPPGTTTTPPNPSTPPMNQQQTLQNLIYGKPGNPNPVQTPYPSMPAGNYGVPNNTQDLLQYLVNQSVMRQAQATPITNEAYNAYSGMNTALNQVRSANDSQFYPLWSPIAASAESGAPSAADLASQLSQGITSQQNSLASTVMPSINQIQGGAQQGVANVNTDTESMLRAMNQHQAAVDSTVYPFLMQGMQGGQYFANNADQGLSPEVKAAMLTQGREAIAGNYNTAKQNIMQELMQRGAIGGNMPGSTGDIVRELGGLEASQAGAASQLGTSIAFEDQNQLQQNRANYLQALGLAPTYANAASTAFNPAPYVSAAEQFQGQIPALLNANANAGQLGISAFNPAPYISGAGQAYGAQAGLINSGSNLIGNLPNVFPQSTYANGMNNALQNWVNAFGAGTQALGTAPFANAPSSGIGAAAVGAGISAGGQILNGVLNKPTTNTATTGTGNFGA